MKAAPSAQLQVQDIFGRDTLIADLWSVLDVGSIRLEAERRIGKTSILQKMTAEPPDGWVPIFLDIEQVNSAAEFSEKVCTKIHQHLSHWQRQGQRVSSLLEGLGGLQFGPIKFPEKKNRPDGYWKVLLTNTIEDLVEQQEHAQKRVVFFFDEMPWMLSAIAKEEGESTAMAVLDLLRSFRQSPSTGQGFRMVLCGSIGLHHVLDELRRGGHRNRPVNDMRLVEVPPFDGTIATDFASRLLHGEGLEHQEAAPGMIAQSTGGFPYYIHWVASELKMAGAAVTPNGIENAVMRLLTSDHDPCDFRHFRERISDYYCGDEKPVLALLDYTAISTAPLAQPELISVAKNAAAVEDEDVRELLRLLAVDHYLHRDTDARYTFRHTLLRRWWVLERGLTS